MLTSRLQRPLKDFLVLQLPTPFIENLPFS